MSAGVATAVGLFALLSAYTGIVQKFDKVETGQKALEAGQLESKSELKEFRSEMKEVRASLNSLELGQRSLELGQRALEAGQKGLEAGQLQNARALKDFQDEVRGDFTIVGFVVAAAAAVVTVVMRQAEPTSKD